MANQRS